MNIVINKARLLNGTTLDGDTLRLPREGGGVRLDELSGATERWLSFNLTVRAAHSMPFELRVFAGGEAWPRVTVRFGVMPRYRTTVCIDLNWLDGHVLFPGHTAGELKVVCHGSRVDRREIAGATLVSLPCFEPIDVLLEDVTLGDEPPRPAPTPDEKLIDPLGQYIPKAWPGKLSGVDEMIERVRAQAALPGEYPFAGWTRWGGLRGMKLGDGVGFFTRIKVDGRWHLLDPDGCAFFSMGPDCVWPARTPGWTVWKRCWNGSRTTPTWWSPCR